jgi:23S rRNA (cytidine1920-2'-O)/16S rRNA (cytidine1409-2'-O)-methyltransferase
MSKIMSKKRLDVLLYEQGYAQSRDEAQRLIRSGYVIVDENKLEKPGTQVREDAVIRILYKEPSFVSRGGLKLEGALQRFSLDVTHLVAADLGASTGGFTDCLLKRGAAKVYAIDVGRGQLAYSLQTDSRVIVMDRTNCRYSTQEDLGEAVDVIVSDLSFISLKTVFSAMQSLLKPDGFAVVLIKPQFEIGKGKVGKKGIVRNSDDHVDVLVDMVEFFHTYDWSVVQLAPSPIQGKSGNIEFLCHLVPHDLADRVDANTVQSVVNEAHQVHTNENDANLL